MMTKQEIFDIIYTRMRAQDFVRSLDAGGTCVYRGEGDRVCAAGALIPDKKYRPEFEFRSITYLCEMLHLDDVVFITQCQTTHDYGHTPSAMQAAFRALAHKHNLTVPE